MKAIVNRRRLLRGMAASLGLPALIGRAAASVGVRKPNILFISIDDLNDFIAPFSQPADPQLGYPGVHTPNIARLAAMGTLFTRAYSHVPACSPSRTATLLGATADRTGIYFNTQSWQDNALGGADSLIGHFRRAGWSTAGAGKIFHRFDKDLRPSDWDEYWMPERYDDSYSHSSRPELSELARAKPGHGKIDFGIGDGEGMRADTAVADWAAGDIGRYFAAGGRFQAVGFFRPHLPWIVGKEFFDLYPPESLQIPPGFLPGANSFNDNAADIDDLPPLARKLIQASVGKRLNRTGEYWDFLRAYLASISFTDSRLGRVLDALEASGEKHNTYIVLWSDHGWMLGEKLSFRKFTLWERALRVPLIIAGPGIRQQVVDQPVSLVDIFPTLTALAGLDRPEWCNGQDLSALLTTGTPLENPAAISIYGLERKKIENSRIFAKVQTSRWNYARYGEGQAELYDHASDPHEWTNLFGTRPEFSPGAPLIENMNRRIGWWPNDYIRPIRRAKRKASGAGARSDG
ncbi:MAG: hypothetical protein D6801_05105 [Alphaproteobacteria bacterium]|nr:MAG: hypothetical protein D6801_05105 [Alphaproteobacteria bacterium]